VSRGARTGGCRRCRRTCTPAPVGAHARVTGAAHIFSPGLRASTIGRREVSGAERRRREPRSGSSLGRGSRRRTASSRPARSRRKRSRRQWILRSTARRRRSIRISSVRGAEARPRLDQHEPAPSPSAGGQPSIGDQRDRDMRRRRSSGASAVTHSTLVSEVVAPVQMRHRSEARHPCDDARPCRLLRPGRPCGERLQSTGEKGHEQGEQKHAHAPVHRPGSVVPGPGAR